MKKTITALVLLVCLLILTILPGCQANSGKTVLNIYNWGEYMSREADTISWYGQDYEVDDVIALFEAAYPQYSVNYQTFDSNEMMYAKLDTASYDLLIPSDYTVVRLLKEDKLMQLDMSKLPLVTQYLDPRLSSLQYDTDKALSDQVSSYAIPYMYCTVGLIYNQDEIAPITSNDPRKVWGVLFDPTNKNRIGMYNSMRESIGVALNYLGYSLNSVDAGQLAEAKQLLIDQNKNVMPLYGIDELKDKYVSTELVAGEIWSGDHVVCQQSLEEGGLDPQTLQYVLPQGSNLSVDMMCIPKNATNPQGAMDFINFMYDPEIALMNAVYVCYSSPNTDVFSQLPEQITSNLSYYPDQATMDTLEIYYSSDEINSVYAEIWQEILAN